MFDGVCHQRWGNPSSLAAFTAKDEEILHLWLCLQPKMRKSFIFGCVYSQRWRKWGVPPPRGGYPPPGVQVHSGNSAAQENLIWEFPLGFQVSRGYPRDFDENSLKTWKSTEIWPNPSGLTVLTPISLISTPGTPFWGGYPPPRGGYPPLGADFHEFSWKFTKTRKKPSVVFFSAILMKIAPLTPSFWL